MQRSGLVHISSMMAFATPPRVEAPDHTDAPWNSHWSKRCDHELRPRLIKYPSGIQRAKMQCIKCGVGVGNNIRMDGVAEQWDDELEQRAREDYLRCEREYKQKVDAFYKSQRGERSAEWWRLYNAYLQSDQWQDKRELVFERAGGICEACGQRPAVQVHHERYPQTFGLEPLWDLRAVCVPCHKIIHPHME
jgi:hypothetical protein